jgi:hypothetical protein
MNDNRNFFTRRFIPEVNNNANNANNFLTQRLFNHYNTFTTNFNTNVRLILETSNSIQTTYNRLLEINNDNIQQNITETSPLLNEHIQFNTSVRNNNRQNPSYMRGSLSSRRPLNRRGSLSSRSPLNSRIRRYPTRLSNIYRRRDVRRSNTNWQTLWNGLNDTFTASVPVIPTTAQIERATRTLLYSDTTMDHDRCPIDRTLFNPNDSVIIINHCGHIFRPNNIMTWFQSSSKCPICRFDIRNDVSGNDVSGNDVPDNDVSGNDVPDNDVPDNDVSGNDVPDNDVPDNDVPDNDVPDNDVQIDLADLITDIISRAFIGQLQDNSSNNVDVNYDIFE